MTTLAAVRDQLAIQVVTGNLICLISSQKVQRATCLRQLEISVAFGKFKVDIL